MASSFGSSELLAFASSVQNKGRNSSAARRLKSTRATDLYSAAALCDAAGEACSLRHPPSGGANTESMSSGNTRGAANGLGICKAPGKRECMLAQPGCGRAALVALPSRDACGENCSCVPKCGDSVRRRFDLIPAPTARSYGSHDSIRPCSHSTEAPGRWTPLASPHNWTSAPHLLTEFQ